MTLATLLFSSLLFGQTPSASDLLAKLDLTSFPNSTGPRHLPSPSTPEVAGFTQANEAEGWASKTSAAEDSWRIGLRVLSVQGDDVVVCFSDVAENGGTYFVQTVLTLTPTDGGYIATQGPADADCPEWRSRSDAAPSQ